MQLLFGQVPLFYMKNRLRIQGDIAMYDTSITRNT